MSSEITQEPRVAAAPPAIAVTDVAVVGAGYVAATIHRDGNVVQPRLGRILHGLGLVGEPVLLAAHPRTSQASSASSSKFRARFGPQ